MIKTIKGLMNKRKSKKVNQEETKNVRDIIPIRDIKDGILITENDFISFMEIMPINFKLRSEREQNFIIGKYEELFKKMKVPFYIFTIAKKADSKPHLDYVAKHIETEENDQVKKMAEEYMEFVKEVARKNTVKRRFIVAVPYKHITGIKSENFDEVKSWLMQQCITFRDAIQNCGNEIIISESNRFTAQIVFELLNVKSSERERIPEL